MNLCYFKVNEIYVYLKYATKKFPLKILYITFRIVIQGPIKTFNASYC